MIIKVTATDIKKGVRGDCDLCPVARAIRRGFILAGLKPRYVQVSLSSVHYTTNGLNGRILLPNKVLDWVERFDDGRIGLKPFSFRMRCPMTIEEANRYWLALRKRILTV